MFDCSVQFAPISECATPRKMGVDCSKTYFLFMAFSSRNEDQADATTSADRPHAGNTPSARAVFVLSQTVVMFCVLVRQHSCSQETWSSCSEVEHSSAQPDVAMLPAGTILAMPRDFSAHLRGDPFFHKSARKSSGSLVAKLLIVLDSRCLKSTDDSFGKKMLHLVFLHLTPSTLARFVRAESTC